MTKRHTVQINDDLWIEVLNRSNASLKVSAVARILLEAFANGEIIIVNGRVKENDNT